jgi:hypothetical protein
MDSYTAPGVILVLSNLCVAGLLWLALDPQLGNCSHILLMLLAYTNSCRRQNSTW